MKLEIPFFDKKKTTVSLEINLSRSAIVLTKSQPVISFTINTINKNNEKALNSFVIVKLFLFKDQKLTLLNRK